MSGLHVMFYHRKWHLQDIRDLRDRVPPEETVLVVISRNNLTRLEKALGAEEEMARAPRDAGVRYVVVEGQSELVGELRRLRDEEADATGEDVVLSIDATNADPAEAMAVSALSAVVDAEVFTMTKNGPVPLRTFPRVLKLDPAEVEVVRRMEGAEAFTRRELAAVLAAAGVPVNGSMIHRTVTSLLSKGCLEDVTSDHADKDDGGRGPKERRYRVPPGAWFMAELNGRAVGSLVDSVPGDGLPADRRRINAFIRGAPEAPHLSTESRPRRGPDPSQRLRPGRRASHAR